MEGINKYSTAQSILMLYYGYDGYGELETRTLVPIDRHTNTVNTLALALGGGGGYMTVTWHCYQENACQVRDDL